MVQIHADLINDPTLQRLPGDKILHHLQRTRSRTATRTAQRARGAFGSVWPVRWVLRTSGALAARALASTNDLVGLGAFRRGADAAVDSRCNAFIIAMRGTIGSPPC